MKFRVSKRSLAAVVLVTAAGFLAAPAGAQEGDTAQMLKDGADLLKRGKNKEAGAKFRAVLAADPSNEDAYNLVKSTDVKVFLEMLKAGGEAEQAAARLLALAHREETAKSQDAAAIKGLVGTAVNEKDHGKRMQAVRQLAGSHGEYAVPHLLGHLASNDIDVRANAVIALTQIGTDAVTPLAASLGSGSDMQRRNVAGTLARIGDERAVPALLRAAAGDGAAAKAAAAAAASLGGSGDAGGAYLEMAEKYFSGDPQTLRNYDGTWTVWSASDGGVSGADVPRFLYKYEMAEQAAYDALSVNAGLSKARALVALCAYAELAAFDGLTADAQGDASLAGTKEALAGARALAAATGTSDLVGAYALAMKLGHADAGAAIADTLGDMRDAGDLNDKNALVAGLTSGDKSFRYASALALLRIDPAKGFAKSNLVAQIAGEAAAEVAVQQVLVIDSESKNAMNTQRALNGAGFHAVVAHNGAAGLLMAKATGGFDCVVVRNTLSDITAFQVLDGLRADFRTQNAKTVVMAAADDVAAAKADYESRGIAGVAPTSADAVGVVNSVKEALGGASDANAAAANALSMAASNAIAGVSGGAFNMKDAEAGLLGALRQGAPDDVRLAALGALANTASPDAAGALTKVLATSENSAAVRAAAAGALATAIRGQAPSTETFGALLAAMGDESTDVRTAAGQALGGAKLSDAQRLEVLQKRRVS